MAHYIYKKRPFLFLFFSYILPFPAMAYEMTYGVSFIFIFLGSVSLRRSKGHAHVGLTWGSPVKLLPLDFHRPKPLAFSANRIKGFCHGVSVLTEDSTVGTTLRWLCFVIRGIEWWLGRENKVTLMFISVIFGIVSKTKLTILQAKETVGQLPCPK